MEATQLLQALANTEQSQQAAEATAFDLANRAAAKEAEQAAGGRGPGALIVAPSSETDDEVLLPSALDRSTLIIISKRIEAALTPAFCLDYDGTLAPIVDDPAAARLPSGTPALLRELANRHPTAIVSGRSMEKLRAWVDVPGLYFAGSHGFEIVGPHGSALNYTFAESLLPSIQEALDKLQACAAAAKHKRTHAHTRPRHTLTLTLPTRLAALLIATFANPLPPLAVRRLPCAAYRAPLAIRAGACRRHCCSKWRA